MAIGNLEGIGQYAPHPLLNGTRAKICNMFNDTYSFQNFDPSEGTHGIKRYIDIPMTID